ncbi:MAG: bifunctional precorrin-2 dehydrogenase/sirohydrochlorin ferrochelatase [Treponema sp.]|nr:bifunctional precorrin-2 dehydrogenase/sirohydrochlorin ferrochelatase [Treponema sp.]
MQTDWAEILRNAENARRFFPLFVDIRGKDVLVIGGGRIALRRVLSLLQFGCRIHIIAEKLCGGLLEIVESLAGNGGIFVELREFRSGDCVALGGGQTQPFFVVAATNDSKVNHAAAVECREHNIPVSVADSKTASTFFFPALVIRDPIVAGITSSGKDHSAVRKTAAKIRKVIKP